MIVSAVVFAELDAMLSRPARFSPSLFALLARRSPWDVK